MYYEQKCTKSNQLTGVLKWHKGNKSVFFLAVSERKTYITSDIISYVSLCHIPRSSLPSPQASPPLVVSGLPHPTVHLFYTTLFHSVIRIWTWNNALSFQKFMNSSSSCRRVFLKILHNCSCGSVCTISYHGNAKRILNAFMVIDQLSGGPIALTVNDEEMCSFSDSFYSPTLELLSLVSGGDYTGVANSHTHFVAFDAEIKLIWKHVKKGYRRKDVLTLPDTSHPLWENHPWFHIIIIYYITLHVWGF